MNSFFRKISGLAFLKRIVTQFIISHLFLATFSIALVGFFLLSETNNFIRNSVNKSSLEKAHSTASDIYNYVKNTFNLLSFATEYTVINNNQTDPFLKEVMLNNMKLDYEFYRHIFIVDSTGAIIASTVIGQDEPSFTDTLFVPDITVNAQSISHVFIKDDQPMITVTTPIRQENILTGLIAEVDMNFVWSLVDSLSTEETGEIVYILDAEGAIIAHPDRKFVYNQTDLSDFSFVQSLIKGNEGTDTYLDPVSNETMICAYVPVEELHWGIVVAQPEAIAFAVSQDIINKLIYIMIGLTALASLLAVVITRNLVQPLNSLVAGVKSLYEGSFPGRISVPRTEELATLAIEFNRMTKNLENAQKKLKKAERVATMSKFASVVAHEIRNPFNSIVINMQVLKRGLENRESFSSLEKFIEIIDAEIRRIDGLINNYMSIARPVEFKLEPHDINVLIDELIILQHEKAAKQSIRIESNYDKDSTMASVDVNQMKQAFLNIMLNAFEAMPRGGKLNISINAEHDNSKYRDYIKISFSDSGVGIKPENIPEVFDFFYTSKRSGTGLGLAVTQKIIQGHKGHIELNSTINRGTSISIFLSQK